MGEGLTGRFCGQFPALTDLPRNLSHGDGSRADAQPERTLAEVQRSEFIYEQPATGAEYICKHALTQEIAYSTLILERRKLLHERAGQALESMFAEQLEDHLDQLAHHY